MTIGLPEVQGFLSYSHLDEEEFGLIEPLTRKLKAFVRATSGRELNLFVDREAIGWGQDWRQSISTSVQGATVFLPLLSANYLASDNCREEFLAFHSKARALGVTELLLPILLFKSPLFSLETDDEVAQISERLQYRCIESAILSGYESAEWLQCTRGLASALMESLAEAEAALMSGAVETARAPVDPAGGAEVLEEEQSGLAEIMSDIEAAADRMNAATGPITEGLEALGAVPESVGPAPDAMGPRAFNAWTLRLANGFKVPAAMLGDSGKGLFEATKEMDETLSRLRQLSSSVEDEEVSSALDEIRRTLVSAFGDLRDVEAVMRELLNSMRPAEVMSVPLRRALQPARHGLTAVRDSLGLIENWQQEFPGESAE